MIAIIKTLQVILALSVLILVHELGHFAFAKMFGIKVDKFFLFFDAGGRKLLSTKSGWLSKIFPKAKEWETEYGIGWLPLGGYCKIAGMVDESMDTDYLKNEPQPWEFRTKPAWQRLLVMAGGVLFNFIFAIIMYITLLAGWGESYISNDDKCIYVNSLAYDMGFRSGDHIISFDDYEPENFMMLQADLARQTASKVTVLRDGDTLDIYIDHNRIGEILNTPGMFDLARPFVIHSVAEGSVNTGSQLEKGDQIIRIDGETVRFVQDAWPILESHAGENIPVDLIRAQDTVNVNLQVDSTGRLGVYLAAPEVKNMKYSLASAVPAGFKKTFASIGEYLQDLKLVFTPSTEAYKSVGSFIAIGQVFPESWDWYSFISIVALLSIMLGVMNLIPIPALDGGHILFTLYEMVTGRKPSDNFLYVTQIIGMILIFGLMFLAFGNDIARLLR
ncbi:MAG: RIP metalloprotease RseP [Bacteroidales bacterium]|nr:RIP metalloprotease RseP [Bacteroidales bacterium]